MNGVLLLYYVYCTACLALDEKDQWFEFDYVSLQLLALQKLNNALLKLLMSPWYAKHNISDIMQYGQVIFIKIRKLTCLGIEIF